MSNKITMTDVAFEILKQHAGEMVYGDLFKAVQQEMNLDESILAKKKRQLYASLMEDNRFASLKGNKWDLRNRRKYEELHAVDDVDDVDDEEDEDEVDDGGELDIPKATILY